MYICFAKIKKGVRIQKGSFPSKETAFCHVHTVPSVQTASFVTGTRIRSPARMCSERIWFNF